ncbi:hypothetical protein SAMN05421863_11283 [Nitrosomonas communis]|uniref:Uncharacterized protein n=1 Tax=Nitrosomonas communis TaxID=44574 RepID=A0A1I4WZB0_9PROT|nr:hypothetical protein SAMN05421863_11283 [Nitrosomonas communis]
MPPLGGANSCPFEGLTEISLRLCRNILRLVEQSRGKAVKQAVCDRGYRSKREVNGTPIILPGKALKQDTRHQKNKKRKQCRRRAGQLNRLSVT